jgi:hypothetical protein
VTRGAVSMLGGLIAAIVCGPAQGACLKANVPDQAAAGRLVVGRFTDFAKRVEHAYILRLRTPACLEGSEDTDKIDRTRTIHLSSTEHDVLRRIKRLVGKDVRVVGEPFGQHTAHHHAPIVMLLTAIDPQ